MFDTVEATLAVERVIESSWWVDGGEYRGRGVARGRARASVIWWEYHEPYLEYRYDADEPERGRLSVQFSVAKLARKELGNVTMAEAEAALDRVDEYVRVVAGEGIASVRDWKVTRMDYAYNFDVGDRLLEYMNRVRDVDVNGMTRQVYGVEGVTWLTQGRWRAIKCYDKARELGVGERRVLRFEVSNYAPAVRYLAQKWFASDRSVRSFVHVGRAFVVLAWALNKIGLSGDAIHSEAMLMRELREDFGHQAASALWVLRLHERYGVEAYKQGLVSQGTYYNHLRELRRCGYVRRGDGEGLPPLVLPIETTILELSQNVGFVPPAPENRGGKIWQKNFGVTEIAPDVAGLLQ